MNLIIVLWNAWVRFNSSRYGIYVAMSTLLSMQPLERTRTIRGGQITQDELSSHQCFQIALLWAGHYRIVPRCTPCEKQWLRKSRNQIPHSVIEHLDILFVNVICIWYLFVMPNQGLEWIPRVGITVNILHRSSKWRLDCVGLMSE